MRRFCEIMVTVDFIFRLVFCSCEFEDISFSFICLNVLEGIKQFYLLMWCKKTSNCGTLFLCEGSENCSIFYAFLFSVTKPSLENGFGFPR